jgi:hypothetical protein
MSDYDKELADFLIKIGQVTPTAATPKPVTKKDEE